MHSPTEVGIVHRDLKNGNILVFKFPEIQHKCFAEGPEGSTSCDVFVKLTDMGVCANPLAYNAKALGGLRQFVPECVTNKASCSLTEKVSPGLAVCPIPAVYVLSHSTCNNYALL